MRTSAGDEEDKVSPQADVCTQIRITCKSVWLCINSTNHRMKVLQITERKFYKSPNESSINHRIKVLQITDFFKKIPDFSPGQHPGYASNQQCAL